MSIRHTQSLSASDRYEHTTQSLPQTTHNLQDKEVRRKFIRLASSFVFTCLCAFSGGALIAASEAQLAPSVDFIVRLAK